MAGSLSVAIVHHEHTPRDYQDGYLVSLLARYWEHQGIEIHHLYGAADFVPADIAVLHVDLSVVPPVYADLARQYPVALNGAVLDIRKRRFSTLAVSDRTACEGPVIVKTDLNSAGVPERIIQCARDRVQPRIARQSSCELAQKAAPAAAADRITSPSRYELYPTSAHVPEEIYQDPRLIVERFVPERRGQWYCHRRYFFLGEAEVNQLWLGTQPICANDEDGVAEDAPIPPALRDFRRGFGIDYGKIDYVLGKDGEVIVVDVNKTPAGACRNPAHIPWLRQLCRDLRHGIYGFLRQPVISRTSTARARSPGN